MVDLVARVALAGIRVTLARVGAGGGTGVIGGVRTESGGGGGDGGAPIVMVAVSATLPVVLVAITR